jgi:LPS-assembly protein
MKHVIESRVIFRHVGGVDSYDRIIRFGSAETVSNTAEAEFSLANRVYVKRGDQVSEMLSWQVWQSRYFDADFGDAVSALDPSTGKPRRNVIASSLNLTGFSFLDGPRRYSPIVSALRISPLSGFGMEWRTDYDPLWRRPVNSWLTADWRRSIYSIMLGHNLVRGGPQLSARANEFNGRFTFGNDNRRGWNAAVESLHDFRTGITRWATGQVTYNTDCCGLSFQYQRFDAVNRKDNVYRVAFSVANIGSFGSLRPQNRLF